MLHGNFTDPFRHLQRSFSIIRELMKANTQQRWCHVTAFNKSQQRNEQEEGRIEGDGGKIELIHLLCSLAVPRISNRPEGFQNIMANKLSQSNYSQ